MADAKIRNIGPKSAAWLRQVGVRTVGDLERVGPVDAFLKVKRAGFRPSLNLLYSMASALADCHWTELPDAEKNRLLAALEAAEASNPIRNRWDRQKDASEASGSQATATRANTDDEPSAHHEPDDDEGAADPERDLNRFD